MSIEVREISRAFQAHIALDAVSLKIQDGDFVALLGPSGSGKTTLLRVIAGLEYADAGRVYFADIDVTNKPVQDRGIGFVFQNYALFRHMTVAKNIAFGLNMLSRSLRPDAKAIEQRVTELLELVQLSGLGARYPNQLSGGQRQRVALARALARDPKILLLDEPFGALDAKVRRELRLALRAIHERLGITTIFVTHDQEEAFALADHVAILHNGKIEQFDSPSQIQQSPNSEFVKGFLA